MSLMKELSSIFDMHPPNLEVFCKLFKYNQSCTSVAESKKSHQEQKNIYKVSSFPKHSQNKIVWIFYIDTQEQKVEIFTNPIDKALFIYLQRKLSVW